MNGPSARGCISGSSRHVVVLCLASSRDLDLRADSVAVALSPLQRELQPMLVAGAVVDPDLRRRAQGRNHQVNSAVAVEVAYGSAAMALGWLCCKARLRRESGKLAVGEIAEHCVVLIDQSAARHVRRGHIAAADKNIFPPVIVEVGNIHAVSGHGIAQRGHAAACGDLGKGSFSIVLKDGERFVLQSGHNYVRKAVVVEVAKIRSHSRNQASVFWQRDSRFKRDLVELVVAPVVKEKVEELVVSDKDVREPVVVVVSHRNSHAFPRMRANAGLRGNILKLSLALVQKELARQFFVIFRMTIFRLAVELAVGFFLAIPAEVVDYEKVEQSVVVDVYPCATHRPEPAILLVRLSQACLLCYVGEGTVAVVVIESVAVDACNKYVLVAVVVVIADRYAHIKSSSFQSGFFRHVGESAVAVVAKQMVPVFGRAFLQSVDVGAIGKEDVRITITVVVKDGDSASHGL